MSAKWWWIIAAGGIVVFAGMFAIGYFSKH